MKKKAQFGSIVWPEVIKITIIFTALIIILSVLYVIFRTANSTRGLW